MSNAHHRPRPGHPTGITIVIATLLTAATGVGAFYLGHARGKARAQALALESVREIAEEVARETRVEAERLRETHGGVRAALSQCRHRIAGTGAASMRSRGRAPRRRSRTRDGETRDPLEGLEGL